ncbi:MAG: T9SS type A sorting domain-containing protein [Chloroflexota bacterium]|nr:T9SS type A sorting domain-containing protein [Lentimicrobium sp.]
MRITLLITFVLIMLGTAQAQERLTGIVVNPRVKEMSAASGQKSASAVQQRITLPFFDDFSYHNRIFPDPARWTDNYVFINNDYALNPPTVGVATFDAIDNQGNLYPHASQYAFSADTLTSVEIRLDSIFSDNPRRIKRSDGVYFSFFYQPQGLGNVPADGDSLILEFLAPDEDLVIIVPADTVNTGDSVVIIPADTLVYENWVRVWGAGGQALADFYNQDSVWFRQVMVPVLDSARFYKPDFKFRFINFATLADATLPDWQSNGDQWNIDYVYLNTGRSANDTVYPDIAFASSAPSFLKTYTSMPYDQYKPNFINEMAKNFVMKIINLDNRSYNATYKYEVTNSDDQLIKLYDGGNYALPPYIESGYVDYQRFSNPIVNVLFPLNDTEPVVFKIKHTLTSDASLPLSTNDSVVYNQVFSNYFSYDDGTAEAGYGITPAGAQVAYEFKLNKNDSLFGVNMFFNKTLTQGNVNNFYLNVWNDEFGKPGELIYSRFGYQPAFEDSLNKFFYYELDSAIFIEPSRFPNLIFYVGWEQVNERMLNLGFDKNDDASSKTFFRTFGDWSSSQYKGALMIRPIVGREKVLAIGENEASAELRVYPNPASVNTVRVKTGIQSSDFKNYQLQVSTPEGKIVKRIPMTDEIDITGMPNGFYFIQITDNYSIIAAEKLIINH